jgi:hypothetical protein
LVGAVDQARLGLAPADRHLERVDDELGPEVIGDLPADYPAAEAIEHDRQVEPAPTRSEAGRTPWKRTVVLPRRRLTSPESP